MCFAEINFSRCLYIFLYNLILRTACLYNYNCGRLSDIFWGISCPGFFCLGQAYSYINSSSKAWGFSDEAGQLAAKVNAAADKDEAKQLANDLQDLTLSEYWEYPLTYTNYVMVSQKNVTGLDAVPVVPEFVDYLKIKVD